MPCPNHIIIDPLFLIHMTPQLLLAVSNLTERHTGGGVDRSVEGDAVLPPVLDDRDVGRGGARDAQTLVDHGCHVGTGWIGLDRIG